MPFCAPEERTTIVVLTRISAPELVRPAEPTTPAAERCSAVFGRHWRPPALVPVAVPATLIDPAGRWGIAPIVAYVLYGLYASYMPSLELTVTEARAQLADLVNRVAYSGDRIVLTRHGRPMAVLISVDAAEAVSASDNAVSDASTIEQLPPPRSLETPQLDYGIAASTTITPTTSGPGHQPGRS